MSSYKISTTELNNDQIIVLSIFKLVGENGFADAEDIAVTADKLIKGKFRWKKYPKYIDLSLIKTLLGNTRDRAKLIKGGKDGWGLTNKGNRLADFLTNKISYVGQRINRLSKFEKEKIEFEMDRIVNNKAFQDYQDNFNLNLGDVRRIFKIDDYSSSETVNASIKQLLRLMKNKPEIYNFLKKAKEVL